MLNLSKGGAGKFMIFSLDIWLMPAIAAGSSSYLVCLAWERLKRRTAPDQIMEIFLAALSFLMGAICAYYRHQIYTPSLENNVIIMFFVGASTTFLWLLFRKYLPGFKNKTKH